MSELLKTLNSIKSKVNNAINPKKENKKTQEVLIVENESLSLSEEQKRRERELRKERVLEKTKNYFESINEIIQLNIGGEEIIQSKLSFYKSCTLKLSFLEKLIEHYQNIERRSKPFFINISIESWEVVTEIIRRLDSLYKEKINILTRVEIPVLEVEAENIFLDDWKLIKKSINLKYMPFNKRFTALSEMTTKELNENTITWDRKVKIQCYICGKENQGEFWKIKHSNATRLDYFVVNGYFGTCRICDPQGQKKF